MNEAQFCQALRGTIAVARRAVADGNFVDLAGFDGEVAILCQAIARLPAAERSTIAAELGALLDELDALSAALTMQSGIEADAARRRAARAYIPPGKPGLPGKPD